MLRHLIEIELEPWLADLRFSPHITIFTNSSVAESERKQLGESLKHRKLGCLVCETITLRTKKTEIEKSTNILECSLKAGQTVG